MGENLAEKKLRNRREKRIGRMKTARGRRKKIRRFQEKTESFRE
jgi:hypothetical protein